MTVSQHRTAVVTPTSGSYPTASRIGVQPATTSLATLTHQKETR